MPTANTHTCLMGPVSSSVVSSAGLWQMLAAMHLVTVVSCSMGEEVLSIPPRLSRFLCSKIHNKLHHPRRIDAQARPRRRCPRSTAEQQTSFSLLHLICRLGGGGLSCFQKTCVVPSCLFENCAYVSREKAKNNVETGIGSRTPGGCFLDWKEGCKYTYLIAHTQNHTW